MLGIEVLHHLAPLRTAFLGRGSVVEFRVLQLPWLRGKRSHAPMGSTSPGPLVDFHYVATHRRHQEDVRIQAVDSDSNQ